MLNSQHTETEEDQEEEDIDDFQYRLLDGKLKDTILTYKQASQTPRILDQLDKSQEELKSRRADSFFFKKKNQEKKNSETYVKHP